MIRPAELVRKSARVKVQRGQCKRRTQSKINHLPTWILIEQPLNNLNRRTVVILLSTVDPKPIAISSLSTSQYKHLDPMLYRLSWHVLDESDLLALILDHRLID